MDSTPCCVRPCVENGVDAAVEVIEHVVGGGGADVAEDVGAGSSDGNSGLADEFKRDWVRGHAHADEWTAGGDGVGDGGGARQKQRERTGPEVVHEVADDRRQRGDQAIEHGVLVHGAGDVDDDGIPCGTLLGDKDAGHSVWVEGICAEAVDGFGGQGDESAGAKNLGRCGDGLAGLGSIEMRGVHGQAEGLHGSIVAGWRRQSHLPYTR